MILTTNKPTRKGLNFTSKHLTGLNMESIPTTTVVLYDTCIIDTCNDEIRLNTGGWKSNHTKNCMNDFMPQGYRVFQKNFEWFVETPKGTLEFTDNMVISLGE